MGARPSVLIMTNDIHPDVTTNARLLFDIAKGLRDRGYQVTVCAGTPRGGGRPRTEVLDGISIQRFFNPHLSRSGVLGRLVNSAVVCALTSARLLFSRRPDVVLADSTSPFLPFVPWLLHRLRGWRYVYLATELYPDVAITLGYLRPEGRIARLWDWANRRVYAGASRVIVIGERLKSVVGRHLPRSASGDKVAVIHNWADGSELRPVAKEENPFAKEHGLTDKLVVLHSGNMGLSHDLETVVLAAAELRDLPDLRFVFIGGGAKRDKIAGMVSELGLDNVSLLPFQPDDVLPYSLTCGDLSIVTLEPGVDGLTIPSKLYSSLAAGQAILALMGEATDVADLVRQHQVGIRATQDDVGGLVAELRRLYGDREQVAAMKHRARDTFDAHYTRKRAIDEYETVLRQAAGLPPAAERG